MHKYLIRRLTCEWYVRAVLQAAFQTACQTKYECVWPPNVRRMLCVAVNHT